MWRIMVHMSNHNKWFTETTGNASGRAAAELAGIPPATLNRQLAKGELAAEFVIAIARAYKTSPVTALVATGFITLDEVDGTSLGDALRFASDQDLVRELAHRIDDEPTHWEGTFDDVVDRSASPTLQAVPSDDDVEAAIQEANDGLAVAQDRTEELIEPESP